MLLFCKLMLLRPVDIKLIELTTLRQTALYLDNSDISNKAYRLPPDLLP